MKEILLTQGKVALVDDADYGAMSQFKWCVQKSYGRWYAIRTGPRPARERIWMHKELLGISSGVTGDHRDGDGLNNQRDNLRACSQGDNVRNRRKRRAESSSRFKGVHWNKRHKKWRAAILAFGKYIYLGKFLDELTAATAYDVAARKLFGEFACVNFPTGKEEPCLSRGCSV